MMDDPVYSAFANIYDQVMRDVDYEGWANYVLELSAYYEVEVKKILDLACGTGSLLRYLARMGYDVAGTDQSEVMLRLAEKKLRKEGIQVPLYRASMSKYDHIHIARDYDLITCLYDSVNYLLKIRDVYSNFKQTYEHLRAGGVYIFDVTTEYNLLHNFAGYTFAENFENASYIWENEYDIVKKICKSKVTIFSKEHGKYNKYIEVHEQRVYPASELKEMLEDIGFKILGTYHNLTMDPVQEKCERIHFVCRKM